MDVVARETRYVTGRSVEHGGAGDSSILTAWGVFQGMRAAAEHTWGSPTLAGRTVGIAGLGKVGKYLAGHLLEDGATVVATDVNEAALAWARATHPQIELVADTLALITSDIDVYAPCALGGALDDDTVPVLRAKVVAGGANNQLAHPGIEKTLAGARHPLHARLRGERRRRDPGGRRDRGLQLRAGEAARHRASSTPPGGSCSWPTRRACRPAVAADRLAEHRMADVGRLRAIYLG